MNGTFFERWTTGTSDEDGEDRGIVVLVAAALAFLAIVTLVLVAATWTGLTPFQGSAASVRRLAQQGSLGFAQIAQTADHAAAADVYALHLRICIVWLVAIVVSFMALGARSRRRQGWSDLPWIAMLAGLSLALWIGSLAHLPPSEIDYWLAAPQTEYDGTILSPLAWLGMRVASFSCLGALGAILTHDVAYRIRQGLEEFGVFETPVEAAAPRARARPETGGASGPAFGRRSEAPKPGPGGRMTTAEAYRVLELADGASRRDITRAHRTAMKTAHPDRGGSTEWAIQLNAARDVLLGRR